MSKTASDLLQALLSSERVAFEGQEWLVDFFEVRQEDPLIKEGVFAGFMNRTFVAGLVSTDWLADGMHFQSRDVSGYVEPNGRLLVKGLDYWKEE